MTYGIGNPSSDLGQEHKCGMVKPVNGISSPLLIIEFHKTMYKQTIKITCTDSLPLKNGKKMIYLYCSLYYVTTVISLSE